jgi:hypothetical protein
MLEDIEVQVLFEHLAILPEVLVMSMNPTSGRPSVPIAILVPDIAKLPVSPVTIDVIVLDEQLTSEHLATFNESAVSSKYDMIGKPSNPIARLIPYPTEFVLSMVTEEDVEVQLKLLHFTNFTSAPGTVLNANIG